MQCPDVSVCRRRFLLLAEILPCRDVRTVCLRLDADPPLSGDEMVWCQDSDVDRSGQGAQRNCVKPGVGAGAGDLIGHDVNILCSFAVAGLRLH